MTEPTLLSTSSEWTWDSLTAITVEINKIAMEELKLDIYPNQIEVITAEQMVDAYSSNGLPLNYRHWSFGKSFIANMHNYQTNKQSLAYEIVINSNPCIAYLMEENTFAMQALVIAHACYGHNAFFKGNYLFKERTQADFIVDYMAYAQTYVAQCEERFGTDDVEQFLDHVHAIKDHGFDHYIRPQSLSKQQIIEQREQRVREDQSHRNVLWDKLISKKDEARKDDEKFPSEPTENILHFIEKYAPNLKDWQRELIHIVRTVEEYFVPQRQTQVGNEGFATFTHRYIIQRLFEKGIVHQGFMQELLISHTNVIFQPTYDKRYYSGINPYALGYAIYTDIKRICTEPTEEDRRFFPHLVDTDWVQAMKTAAFEHRDETFILQYLSPKVMRDFKLFAMENDSDLPYLEIQHTSNDEGFKGVRQMLANQYNMHNRSTPLIEVDEVNIRGDRQLTLKFTQRNETDLLEDSILQVLPHIKELWGFNVRLQCVDEHNQCYRTFECTGSAPNYQIARKNDW